MWETLTQHSAVHDTHTHKELTNDIIYERQEQFLNSVCYGYSTASD